MADFHNKKSAKDGKQSACKECNKAAAVAWQKDNDNQYRDNCRRRDAKRDTMVRKSKTYGISVEELEALFEAAGGVCMICKREPHRWLVIDHCHNSLKVRGILCEKCNQALGLFNDDVVSLKNAIEYLSR